MAKPITPVPDRFWPKVNKTETCWLWTAQLDFYGYGAFGVQVGEPGRRRRRALKAHRVAYELVVGPIPEGLDLDHLCRVPACVNPAHLEPVTRRENTMRGTAPVVINAAKTHCVNGHPFDEANTYRRPLHPNHRACRTCHREKQARYHREKRALQNRGIRVKGSRAA